ncbi:basement membrane-specific heparan sulfate proteoglycan core protein-like [Betta splendens]|uniref:Basement membrane-specific heparan sulfate proteoglycan core protein-like n=1 Tax=Betta splendens TaxID=158456 RepID=A0A9W2X9H5_BETSP|nr:basement membrane-specific heparan sulfate proteoglycan core protein-like [Betta splendens]
MTGSDPGGADVRVTAGGEFYCRGGRGEPPFYTRNSNKVTVRETVPNRATVNMQPNWSVMYTGETVSVTCQIHGGGRTEWTYEWNRDMNRPHALSEYKISPVSKYHSGIYRCRGRKNSYTITDWSNIISLTVAGEVSNKAAVKRQHDWPEIFKGEEITLTCEIQAGGDTEWEYEWTRGNVRRTADGRNLWVFTASGSRSGDYKCRGRQKTNSYSFTAWSDPLRLRVKASEPKAELRSDETDIPVGGSVMLSCSVTSSSGWKYYWYRGDKFSELLITQDGETGVSQKGLYWCRGGRGNPVYYTQYSDSVTVEKTASKPRASVKPDRTTQTIQTGESVTLSCSVDGSDGWKYYWYQRSTDSSVAQAMTGSDPDGADVRVTAGGEFYCRGGRGEPPFYTQNSSKVTVRETVPNRATVDMQPNWSVMYPGETVSVTCQIQGGRTEWTYEWNRKASNIPHALSEYKISPVSKNHSGIYSCRGRKNSYTFTDWSNIISLTVEDKAQCVLTASPSWLSPGASVALSCEVEPPSAGWRFYWYQTVPDGSHSSYRYELLPGSEHGTEQGSYMLDGHTHTAGYVCRAARGEPVYYTDYSKAAFVWSGDVDPSASLTVSPDTVQHFTSDSVSLSCEGNSTEWRVRRFPEGGFLSSCSYWTTSGSRCDINTSQSGSAVFWCESGSGHFSNSVNITVHGFSPEAPSFSASFTVGLVVRLSVIVFLLLLLLLCVWRNMKAHRSVSTDKRSATQQTVNQLEPQLYSSLLHGDVCVYESVEGSGNNDGGTHDDTEEDDNCNNVDPNADA